MLDNIKKAFYGLGFFNLFLILYFGVRNLLSGIDESTFVSIIILIVIFGLSAFISFFIRSVIKKSNFKYILVSGIIGFLIGFYIFVKLLWGSFHLNFFITLIEFIAILNIALNFGSFFGYIISKFISPFSEEN